MKGDFAQEDLANTSEDVYVSKAIEIVVCPRALAPLGQGKVMLTLSRRQAYNLFAELMALHRDKQIKELPPEEQNVIRID